MRVKEGHRSLLCVTPVGPTSLLVSLTDASTDGSCAGFRGIAVWESQQHANEDAEEDGLQNGWCTRVGCRPNDERCRRNEVRRRLIGFRATRCHDRSWRHCLCLVYGSANRATVRAILAVIRRILGGRWLARAFAVVEKGLMCVVVPGRADEAGDINNQGGRRSRRTTRGGHI
jgi:hypothetical protein